MIIVTQVTKDYINSQADVSAFCERLEISRQTLYNILKDEHNVSSETIAKLLDETGFSFEAAFEVRPDHPVRRKEDK